MTRIERKQQAADLRLSGLTIRQVAERMVCSPSEARVLLAGTRAQRMPRVTMHPTPKPTDRLWDLFQRRVDGCWRWLGGKYGRGPGSVYRGERMHARSLAWALVYGEVPDTVPKPCPRWSDCVNPDHLWHPPSFEEVLEQSAKRDRIDC